MREILAAGLKTGSGTLAVIFFGVLSTKIMAVILGPSGMGLYSLLGQLMSTMVTLGTLGGQNAIVQGLSSREGEPRDSYLVTTFWLVAAGAAAGAGVLIAFAPWIARRALGDGGPQFVALVRWLALPVCLSVAYTFFNAVLNGFRSIGVMAAAQAAAAAVGLLLAYPAARLAHVGYPLAFIGLMAARCVASGTIVFVRAFRSGWLAPLSQRLFSAFEGAAARHFISIAGTTLATGLIEAGTMLVVRAIVVHGPDGLAAAGMLDVAWTLSTTYVMLILSSFGTYYLPTLAGTKEADARHLLIRRLMRLQVLLMVPLVVSVIALKPLLIHVLYSAKFYGALGVIRWMLIGDYVKVASFVLIMPVLAKADMRAYFWIEVSWQGGFLALTAAAFRYGGSVEAVGRAFMIMYAVYFAIVLRYVNRRYGVSFGPGLTARWLLGLAVVIGASWLTWSDSGLHWLKTPALIGGALLFSALTLSRDEWASLRSRL